MKEKILFVESDNVLLETYKKFLGKKYSIDTALDATTGLKKLVKDDNYAVVLADLMMKDMDGIKFFSQVKELAPDSIRIMLTGNPELDIAVNAVNEGDIFRFITKPLDLNKFMETVELGINEYEKLERLKKESLKDSLTGLWNRRYFDTQIKRIISASKRFSQQFAILYFDIDDFKEINDLYGHNAGDEALQLVAKEMDRICRAHDTIFRLGGDEFCVLTENTTRDKATALMWRIKRAMAGKTIHVSGPKKAEIKVKLSIGIAVYPEDGFEQDVLLYVADQAMYKDKELNKKEK